MAATAYFLSEETLKSKTVVSENLDTKILNQTIWLVQEERIQQAIGTDLYNRLQAGIIASDLTADETTLLNNYITNVMVFYVMAELPMVLGFKFYNKNILKKSADNAEAATMTELADIMSYYQNKAEFFEARLIKYLQDTASNTVFPEYFECTDLLPKKKAYKCSIVLNQYQCDEINDDE